MSDDLVKRLTHARAFLATFPVRSMEENHEFQNTIEFIREAADRIEELEAALRLILPLAKGYNPQSQTASARRTCNEWIATAEAALGGTPDEQEL